MRVPSLGVVLFKLREKRGLKLRELGTLAEVDHSYIYKLEVGDKVAPSESVLQQLIKTLHPTGREKQIFDFVLSHPNASPELVGYALDDDTVTVDELALASGAAHRGTGRPDPKMLIDRARIALKAFGEGPKT